MSKNIEVKKNSGKMAAHSTPKEKKALKTIKKQEKRDRGQDIL